VVVRDLKGSPLLISGSSDKTLGVYSIWLRLEVHEEGLDATNRSLLQCVALCCSCMRSVWMPRATVCCSVLLCIYIYICIIMCIYIYIYTYRGRDLVAALQIVTVTR